MKKFPTRVLNGHKLSLPSTMTLSKVDNENEEVKVDIKAYTGNAVDLSDYGVDHPVVYNIAGIEHRNKVPFLSNHWQPIGHLENIKKSNTEITGEGIFSYPNETSKEVSNAIQKGFPMQSSMGLDILEKDVTFVEEGVANVNGRTFNAPVYVVNKSVLLEQSAVLFGRDDNTTITQLSKEAIMRIKNQKPGAKVDNTPDDKPDEKPVSKVDNEKDVKPTPTPAPTPAPTPSGVVDNGKVTTLPHSAIFRLSREAGNDPALCKIVEEGLDNAWDEERINNALKLHKLENDYPKPPSPRKTDEGSEARNVLLGRLGISMNVGEEYLAKKLGEKTFENSFQRGPLTLKELIVTVANSNGGNFNGFSDIEDACAFIKNSRYNNTNQYSTIVFPNLLDTITQFRMEEHWTFGEPWAPKRLLPQSQTNFKPTGRIRPGGGTMWEQLDKDGRLRHGEFGTEKTYETTLDTVGQILTFKRKDIINDDLGVIEEMMRMMVEGATMIPDFMFVNKLYNGIASGFFVDGTNASFGAGAALTEATLRTAYERVREHNIQKGEKYVKTMFDTRWKIVVPPGLEEEAWEIVKQAKIVSNTTSDTKQGEKNYWFGRLDIDVFTNLDNPTYHDKAASDVWGLMPVRQSLAPYSITYLNNQRKPKTEVVDLPADMLGFGVRGYWDLDVNERESETIYFNFPSEEAPS